MPFARQRLAVLHSRTASKPLADPQSDNMTSHLLVHEIVENTAVEIQPAVAGFRYLWRRSTPSRFSPLTLAALSAVFCMGNPSGVQAKSSHYSHSSHRRKAAASKPTGCWAWTAGSMTYLRARPGIQTPPVAKVPRHTKLMVWGKFDGWFRVETTDHKFGWVHNELVNSPELEKIKEMSHSQAREASNKSSNQLMFGSVAELKKHYQRFGSSGAKKGLAVLGVNVGTKSSQSNKQKFAAHKAAPQKIALQKIALQKMALQKIALQKAAQAKLAQQEAAQAKLNQAKWAAAKAEQKKFTAAKIATAKAAQEKLAAARAAQEKLAAAKAEQAKIAAKPTPIKALAKMAAPTPTQPKSQPAPAMAQVAPPVKAPSGTALPPILPNPTAHTPTRVVTPAIPIPPKAPSQSARQGNVPPPSISPEDLMRAREQHLKRRSSAPSSEKAPQASNQMAFVPQVYYLASAVYAPSMAGDNVPVGQFTPRTEESGPRQLFLPLERSVPAISPQQLKVVLAKTSVTAPAKPAPSRGGSPRDYVKVNKNEFGQGVASQALSYRGRPYIRGAASPSRGFDCSGLVYYLLRQRGLNPPRTAAGLASYGTPVPMGQLQAGDLVLFANTYKRGVSHVGIYTGNNNFVHAATSGTGVRLSSLGEAYYCRKYWGARRVPVKK